MLTLVAIYTRGWKFYPKERWTSDYSGDSVHKSN